MPTTTGAVPVPVPPLLLLLILAAAPLLRPCSAVMPTASVDVFDPSSGRTYTLLASQASFGSYPPMNPDSNPVRTVALPPQGDELLCNEADGAADYSGNDESGKGGEGDGEGGGGGEDDMGGTNEGGTVMLVPRGSCTFERKALSAQRLGASAVIVYGTLYSRYSLNETQLGPNATDAEKEAREQDYADGKKCWGRECAYDDIVWPLDRYDYDCDRGGAMVPTSVMSFDPLPYDGHSNDPRLSGWASDGNLCALRSDDPDSFAADCESRRCLLTGRRGTGDDGGTTMEACCAWDLHVWLYADPSVEGSVVRIPAFYVTMEQGSQLLGSASDSSSSGSGASVSAVMYARYKPEYNPSAAIIWALGVSVAALAAWLSASDYREEGRRVVAQRELRAEHEGGAPAAAPGSGGGGVGAGVGGGVRSRSRSRSPGKGDAQPGPENGVGATYALDEEAEGRGRGTRRARDDTDARPPRLYRREDSALSANGADQMELGVYHAFGFVVMASSALLVLFFLKVYSFVKVLYAFGCSGALTQVFFYPLYSRLAGSMGLRGGAEGVAFTVDAAEIGPVTYLDLVSAVSGYALGIAWLAVAFVQVHPESNAFFWVVQDLMGASMCVLFLSVIKLNSIRVAAMLLIVAFLYDIFFVFVTPLLTPEGQSIMITVATSGGPPKADPSWCEKYPRDRDCAGGDPLPMLLTVPRIGDYQGGASLLGLGDIVLPGLLLSFAARFDEAKRLIGLLGGGAGSNRSNTCPRSGAGGVWPLSVLGWCSPLCDGGYLAPAAVAYAVGLLMANAAVYVMGMGQPALLYLVPCCLGTMVFLGWRRGEMDELWCGPRVVRAADRLVYGDADDDDAAAAAGGGEYVAVGGEGRAGVCRADDAAASGGSGGSEEGGVALT